MASLLLAVLTTLLVGGVIAMDDDVETSTAFLCSAAVDRQKGYVRSSSSTTISGKGGPGKGQYHLPDFGICWIWKRDSTAYTGFCIRDLSANCDLCEVVFKQRIQAASTARGRRSSIILPQEDRELLKSECTDGIIRMEMVEGTILETSCAVLDCSLADVEFVVRMRCPWEDPAAHRVELASSVGKKLGSSKVVPRASDQMAIVPQPPQLDEATQPGDISLLDNLVNSIGTVLTKLHQPEALSQLKQLHGFLNVTCRASSCAIVALNCVLDFCLGAKW